MLIDKAAAKVAVARSARQDSDTKAATQAAQRRKRWCTRVAPLAERYCTAWPPEESILWPESALHHWFAAGGILTQAIADELPERINWDLLGAGLPTHIIAPASVTGLRRGLMGCVACGDTDVFDHLAQHLCEDGFIIAELGGFTEAYWSSLVAEGEELWPKMKPGAQYTVCAAAISAGARHSRDEMGWDGMRWDVMGRDRVGYDGTMGRNKNRMGRDGPRLDRLGWDGMGWDGMGSGRVG